MRVSVCAYIYTYCMYIHVCMCVYTYIDIHFLATYIKIYREESISGNALVRKYFPHWEPFWRAAEKVLWSDGKERC